MATFVENPITIPPLGRVPLADKLCPLFERELKENEAMAYTLAQVDVSLFKEFLLNSPKSIWSGDYHDKENVKLMRPAHDAWGIEKIMFTFCDDFLLKVLDLPFSQDPKWRQFLVPIYEACGIPENRIVRSLLASMPPGVNIPVHHDTGFWVQHTHRVHVAISTDVSSVHFMIGHKNEDGEHGVKKYSFDEGRVVELNNQAKHAVRNEWNQNRIHLIFDYVDAGFPLNRFKLQKGDKVHQTRRSIDLASHAGMRPTPSFMIIGAQKSGTTSMYEYLCQHPLVVRGTRRETHYFDWRWSSSCAETDDQAHREQYLKYFNPELHTHPSVMSGESTPSYLLHADIVIPRLLRVVPHLRKFLVMLRNPVSRAYSQYQMSIDQKGTPEQLALRGHSKYSSKSFKEAVEEEIRALQARGIHADMTAEEFRRAALEGLPMGHGGHSLVLRGLYALQLLPWFGEFGADNIKVISIGQVKGDRANTTMQDVFKFVGLPPIQLQDTEAKNARTAQSPLNDDTRRMLEEFYTPYNERLFSMLGRKLDDW